jgi:tripartite-type tricarboxylate transporter receptor subunit TctC
MGLPRRLAVTALVLAGCSAWAQQAAQPARTEWPTRPVKIIVPFPAGGGYDLMARNIGQKISDSLGQPVVVENRAGANGNIGSDAVAKSAPDGYTLLLGGIGPQAFSVALYPKLPFNPEKDLAPVSLVASQPNVLVTHPGVPAKSLQELIAQAKARPGQVSWGSTGSGSGQHFGLEQLKSVAGIDVIHVPYKGAAPLHQALLAGEVNAGFNIIQLPMQHVRKGELKALATASKKRSPLAPDVPTMAELGYPIDFDTWYALYAPAGTPADIVAKLNAHVNRALADPQLKERAGALGLDLIGSTPEQLSAHMHQEITRWSALAKAANIKAGD